MRESSIRPKHRAGCSHAAVELSKMQKMSKLHEATEERVGRTRSERIYSSRADMVFDVHICGM